MANYFFPLDPGKVSWKTQYSQSWDVAEVKSASGRRRALVSQLYPDRKIHISFPAINKQEVDTLIGFYEARKGAWQPFFYKDYTDYRVERQTLVRGSDGRYQCVVAHGGAVSPAEYVDNVKVYANGNELNKNAFTVSGGKISTTAQGTITASYDYYYKVVFEKSISVGQLFDDVYAVSLTLSEVR